MVHWLKGLMGFGFVIRGFEMPTIDISITVPSDVVQAVTAWRKKQIIDTETGELKYPNNVALIKDIIKQAVIRILDQEATDAIKAEVTAIDVARTRIQTLKDQCVT